MKAGKKCETCTFPYSAPEIVFDEGIYQKTDVYSIMVMIYELYVNKYPNDVRNGFYDR
jgi:serine/threonine protein kinase